MISVLDIEFGVFMISSPWNIVGLSVTIVIVLSVIGVLVGLLRFLVYRPERKPELKKLPEVPTPKLLTTDVPEEVAP